MPYLVPPPPPPAVEVRPISGLEETPRAHGIEGQHVETKINELLRQLRDRLTCMIDDLEPVSADYVHVPFAEAGTIRVRYKPATQLRPRRFSIEDDEE